MYIVLAGIEAYPLLLIEWSRPEVGVKCCLLIPQLKIAFHTNHVLCMPNALSLVIVLFLVEIFHSFQ